MNGIPKSVTAGDLAGVYALGVEHGVRDQEERFMRTIVQIKNDSRAREEKLLQDLRRARECPDGVIAVQVMFGLLLFLSGFAVGMWINGGAQ